MFLYRDKSDFYPLCKDLTTLPTCLFGAARMVFCISLYETVIFGKRRRSRVQDGDAEQLHDLPQHPSSPFHSPAAVCAV